MKKAYIVVGWWGGTCRTVLDELAVSQVAVAEDKGGRDVAGNQPVRRSRHWVGQSNDCGYGRAGVYGQEINVGVAVNMGDNSEGVVSVDVVGINVASVNMAGVDVSCSGQMLQLGFGLHS